MDVAICPGCNLPTTTVLDNGKQAFCQNDDCRIVQFDSTRTYTAEELANAKEIELPDWLA
jgi:hypothetical protein